MNSRMVACTLDSGKTVKDMVRVNKYGQMARYMKGTGRIMQLLVKVDLFTQMEIYMKVNGMQIKLMVMYMSFLYSRVHISTWMELNMKDNGWMINKMEWAKKFGLMVQDTRVIISREKNMELDNFFGLMDLSMRENSNSIIFKELAFTSGQTVVNMMVNGKIIKWMERGYQIY